MPSHQKGDKNKSASQIKNHSRKPLLHCDIKLILRQTVTICHEFFGVVAEVGRGVTTCVVGDGVTSETAYLFCGRCDMCKSGFCNTKNS